MRASTKWKTWGAVVAAACAFLLQGCAIMARRTSQEIPVTSHPGGAKIIVNGKEMGVTPLSLKLARKKTHLIRIEKAGYVPLEIKAPSQGSRERPVFIMGNMNWGWMAAMPGAYLAAGGLLGMSFGLGAGKSALETGGLLMLLGMAVGLVASLAVDSSPGADSSFQFEDFNVTLQKMEDGTNSDVAVMTLEHWQYVKWIRIGCAGSDVPAGSITMQ
jgi:hypothetical protein